MKLGILPLKSSSVCTFTADLVRRNSAHGKSDRHRSMCRRIQCVCRVLQLDTENVAGVEFARQNNQTLKKFDMNAPVSRLAGIGQCRALDLVPETHVVELGSLCRQADFDIAQTLAGGQFCKGHYPELLGAGKRFGITATTMSIDKSG